MCFSQTAPKSFAPPLTAGSSGDFAPASVYASGVPPLTDAGAPGGGDAPPEINPNGGVGGGVGSGTGAGIGGGGSTSPIMNPNNKNPYLWLMPTL